MQLPDSLAALGRPEFAQLLNAELRACSNQPPLQQALQRAMRQGSQVLESDLQIQLQSLSVENEALQLRLGVFFSSLIAGCNCADEPLTPDLSLEHLAAE
ncbi:MAG: hypothetical protein HQL47_11245, partial [Gammaproteobacteria bacterium]|nr:hypothetical protein [Gammaproteobacteria bacterium]